MVVIVCGPPCSGKSTYVLERAASGDLVIDHDAIAVRHGSPRSHNHHGEFSRVAEREVAALLAEIASGLHPNAWVIRSYPTAADREALARLSAQVTVLTEPRGVLVSRAMSRPNPAATIRIIDWWLAKHAADERRLAL